VVAKSPVPIATGEGLFSGLEFKQLLDVIGAAISSRMECSRRAPELCKIANMATLVQISFSMVGR
jgi:hypothetical protein